MAITSSNKGFNDRSNRKNDNIFVGDMLRKKALNTIESFHAVRPEEQKYRDFMYETEALKFIDNNRNEIYRGTEDPREEMYRQNLTNIIGNLFPELPEDYRKKNALELIKSVAGDDMSATNVFEVVGQKVQEGISSAMLGMKLYFGNFKYAFEEDNPTIPDEIKKKHTDDFKKSVELVKSKQVRTDYYNKDFTGLAEKMFLSAADFVPSMALSMAPSAVGLVLSKITHMPFLYTIGKGISGTMAGLMEAGSITTDLISAGASPKMIRDIATGVGIVNGLLEYAGDFPERKTMERIGKFKSLRKAVGDRWTGELQRGLAREVMAKFGARYALGMITEPATEIAQEFVSMYAMNLASIWNEMNTGRSFADTFTYTPQEMAEAIKEVGLSTVRGQALIGLGFSGLEMFKDVRNVQRAQIYTKPGDSSIMMEGSSFLARDGKVDVQETKKGRPEAPFDTINARVTSIGTIPNTEKEADIVGYIRKKDKNASIYINPDKSDVTGKKATRDQYINLVDALLDKDSKGNDIKVEYIEDGKLKVADSQVAELITTLISGNYDKYQGITEETVENGRQFNVTFDGTTYTFTTQDSVSGEEITNSVLLSQKDAKINEALEKMAEKNKKIAEDRQKALAKGVDEYLAKPLEERRNEFIRDARNTFIRQGYTGEELTKQIDATRELLSKNQSVLDKANDIIKKKGILKRGVSVESFTTSINNGLVGTIVSLAKRFGTDMTWAKDHVVFDAGMGAGIEVTPLADGTAKIDYNYGNSYWTDGTKDENGNLKHIKNYREIADKSKAQFHVSVTDLVDQTTAAHEAGHMFVSMGEESLMKDKNFLKAFRSALMEDNTIKDINGKNVVKPESEWVLGDKTHEAFCEKLETYINTGLADNAEQVSIFKAVLAAMRDLWKSVKEFLTKDQQAFFDKLFDASNDAVYNEQYSVGEESDESSRSKREQNYKDDIDFGTARHKRFTTTELSDSEIDTLYKNFHDSYVDATGSSWDKDYFERKARSWLFWGSENGGVAVRLQNSGLLKLNACYGSPKAIFDGFKSMINEAGHLPIWGAMTENLSTMIEKASSRFGSDKTFKQVPEPLAKVLTPNIAKIFGQGVTVNDDGTITAKTPAGADIKKVLVANNAYYEYLANDLAKDSARIPIPFMDKQFVIDTAKILSNSEFNNTSDENARKKSKTDYIRDYEYNKERIKDGMLDIDVALKRDGVYVDNLVSAIEYILGGNTHIDEIYIEAENDELLPKVGNEWTYDKDKKLNGNIAIWIPDGLRTYHLRVIAEYLANVADFNTKENSYEIRLPNGFMLKIFDSKSFQLPLDGDSEREEIRKRGKVLENNGNALGTMQNTERAMWGDLIATMDHHSHVLFQDLDITYAMNGLGSQAYGAGNYGNTDKENVGQGYRDRYFREADAEARYEITSALTKLSADAIQNRINPRLEEMVNKTAGISYWQYGIGADGISFSESIPVVGKNFIPVYQAVNNGYKNILEHFTWLSIQDQSPFTIGVDEIEKVMNNMFDVEDSDRLIFNFSDSMSNVISLSIAKEMLSEEDYNEILISSVTSSKGLSSNDTYNRLSAYIETDMISYIDNEIIPNKEEFKNLFLSDKDWNKKAEINKQASSILKRVRDAVREFAADGEFVRNKEYNADKLEDAINNLSLSENDVSYWIRKIVSNEYNKESAKKALADFLAIYPKGINLLTYSEATAYKVQLPEPTVKYYTVARSGEDSDYLKWDEQLDVVDADKIYNGLKQLGYEKGYDDTKDRRAYTWIVSEDSLKNIIYNEPFKEVYHILEDVFLVNDGNIMRKDKYYNAKYMGYSVDGVTPADRAVSDFLSSLGFVGHQVPGNFRSGNNDYESPNYVIYQNEGTKTTRRVEYTDPRAENSRKNIIYFNDKNARYKREYETISIEKELAEGRPVSRFEVSRYWGESEWVKAEQNAQRIVYDGSIQWVSNLFKKSVKDYLGDKPFVYSELTDEDWASIADSWKKEINDELKSRTAKEKRAVNETMTTDLDAVKLAKRMSADLQLQTQEGSVRSWLNQFTGKNGRTGDVNISALARKLRDTTDLLDEKQDVNGVMLSVNFPYLDWVLQYNEKNKTNARRNKGTNAVYDGAEREIETHAEQLYQIDQGNTYQITDDTDETLENDITEGEYQNVKVSNFKKLLNKLRKTNEESERNRQAWVNLSDVNERLTGEFYARYQKLQELAEKNGIKRDSWETFDDLVDRIEESDEALKAVNEELGKEYLETTLKNMQTIEENNQKIQELASEIESDEDVIQNQKTALRNKDREIRDYIGMIEKLADELEQASIREALGDSLLLSQYKDYEKKVSTLQKELGKLQKKYDDLFFEYADEETGARFLKELLRDADKKLESLRNKYASAEKMAGKVISKTHVQANEDAPLSRKIELIGMKLTRTMRALNRKVDEYYRLDRRYQVARERYETIRAQRMVENSKRKWRRKLEAKSGDADRRRAMREFSKAFFQVPNEARPWKNLYLGELMNEALPRTIDILSKLGFIQTDKDGQTVLAKGFNDLQLDSKLFKDIYSAIKGDVESTVDLKKSRDEDMTSRYTQLVPQFVEQMAEKKLSRKLEAQAREMVADKKFKTLEDARLSIINERVGKLHEGSEAYKKELKKLGYNRFNIHNLTAFASFESLWNLAGKISPKLRDALFFEFEYDKLIGHDVAGKPIYEKTTVHGLNHITNKSLDGKRHRINEMHERVLTELGLWTKDEKTNKKNWAEFMKQMNERQETGQTFDIHRRLQEDERFMHMAFEYDKDGNIVVDEDGSFVVKIPYDPNYSDDSYNLQEVLAIYVHSKNAESFSHLFNDRSSLTPWQMAYIVNEVENENGKFHKWQKVADIIQEKYEEKFEEISDKSNLVNNKSLKKVDIYLPFNAASDSKDIDITLDTQFGEQQYTGSADVGAGTPAFTLERQGGNNPINLDFVSEFDRVVGAQEYFINGAEFFKTWNEILSSKGGKLKLQIQNVFGMNQANTFVKNLQMCKDIVTSSPEDGMNRIVNTLRNNMALANLGFNVSSIIQQPFVWFLGASRFGYARMIKAMSAYRQYDSIKAWKEHMYELAPQIRETTNMQLGYAHEAVENSKALKGLKKVAEWGMWGIEKFDEITRLIMFQAGMDYYSSLETEVDGKKVKTYTQEQAAERAIQDVMNMNSSRQAKDNALIYNSKSPYWKALLMFTNQLNKQWNMLLGEDGLQALFEGKWKKTIGTLLGLGLATSGVLLAKGKLLNNGSGDDDEWWKDLLKDLATESVEMIPVIGDEISSAINGYSYMDSNIVSSTINFGKRVAETISEPTKKNKRKTVTATKNMAVDFLTLIGAPKYPFQHTYNALFEKGKFVGDTFFDDLNGISRVLLPTEWYEYLTKELFND